MKKVLLLLLLSALLFILVLSVASCGAPAKITDSPANDSIIEPETTTEEPMPEPPIKTPEELYDMLMANQSVWERENMINGTLIDLDFDGMPEFILMSGYSSPAMTIFKYTGDVLKEIKHIDSIYVPENVYKEFKVILPYKNEKGVKSWVIPYIGDDGYRLSAFEFKGENVGETVKFNSKINYQYPDRDKYYGYEYLDAQFYIDGAEHKAPQDKLDAFQIELDRIVQESAASEEPGLGVPWSCGRYYPNPSQAEWEEKKTEFLNSLLAAEPAYNLFPGGDDDNILWSDSTWREEKNIAPAIKKLTEAYYSGDDAYLRTNDLIYDNGGAMCKPVIYLYPVEPTDITVYVDFPNGGNFTCAYPDYNGGWNVTAYPDGTLINKTDGLEYSYLYWEGEGNVQWDFSGGFVVKGGDTAKFLREKLAYLGLTPREYNEFIVYWLPLMQNNNYNLIAFQTGAYEESAKLYISPQPDSVLRVFMAYTPLDNAIKIPEQTLERFERTGFSVIEWGGACVD